MNKLQYLQFLGKLGNQGGKKQAWTPSRLSGLSLWLDANDASTITLNGSTVSQWDDKSGNGRNATQATAANQPTYTPSGLNGKPVITFSGAQVIVTPTFVLGDAVMIGQRSNTLEPAGEIVVASQFRGLWGNVNDFETFAFYGVDGESPTYDLLDQSPNHALNTPLIVSCIGPQTGSSVSIQFGRGIPGYQPLNGFFSEVVMVGSSLSVGDRQKLEGYLAWKWGLTASLPVNHPYKNLAPTL